MKKKIRSISDRLENKQVIDKLQKYTSEGKTNPTERRINITYIDWLSNVLV